MNTSTKIVNGLSEFKEEKKLEKSLADRIKDAKNEVEVNYLLKVGSSYKRATTKTMKMWSKIAADKINSFKSQ